VNKLSFSTFYECLYKESGFVFKFHETKFKFLIRTTVNVNRTTPDDTGVVFVSW